MKALVFTCVAFILLFSACTKSSTPCTYHVVFSNQFYGQSVAVRVDNTTVLNTFIDPLAPIVGDRGAFDFTANEGRHKLEIDGKELNYKGKFKLPKDIAIYVSISTSNTIEVKTSDLYFELQ